MRRIFGAVFILALLMGLGFSASAATLPAVVVVVRPDAPGPVLFGANELVTMLRCSKLMAGDDAINQDTAGIVIKIEYSTQPDRYPEAKAKLSALSQLPAESYMILKARYSNPVIWLITAPDPVGAMYGALDLAEQIDMKLGDKKLSELSGIIEERTKSPFIEIRAVNPFLQVQSFNDPGSWFYSDEYWRGYLDQLARSRYNLLDIHAMYDLVSTQFPNCFLYLLNIEEYPDVGLPKIQAERNLKQLGKIIAMAKDRGIRVSLMSYHASWALSGRESDLARIPSDDELADYTRIAVKKIIQQLQELWMTGFRIGEGGRPADFFQQSYLKGIGESGRDIFLFTRSWVTPPEQVLAIADAYPGKTFIEIKFNGEHLGLPYHAMVQPWRAADPSYSYESYTNWPRKYRIIWQIRANGTHRLFRWGDPEFAARVMRSVRFGAAAGFTMEPMSSYYPPVDFYHPDASPYRIHKYEYQRNWFWYFLWGRTAYDPDTGGEVWLQAFKDLYGETAAAPMLEAMARSSHIIPTIYAYRCIGPDHRNMAPEYETGGTLYDFILALPLDPNAFMDMQSFIVQTLSGSAFAQARLTPLEIADYLEKESDAAIAAIGRVPKIVPEFTRLEAEDMAKEIALMRELAYYYAEKIRASVAFAKWQKRKNLPDLDDVETLMKKAADHWNTLAVLGEKHFKPLLDTLRMHTTEFTWRKEGENLQKDFDIIAKAREDFKSEMEAAGPGPVIYHCDVSRHNLEKDFEAQATVLGSEVKTVSLVYQLPGKDAAETIEMKRPGSSPVYRAIIPRDILKPGELLYRIEARSARNTAEYPKSASSGRLRNINVVLTDDFTDPEIIPVALEWAGDAKDKVKITVKVKDSSPVQEVRLLWKPVPSIVSWKNPKTMEPTPDGNYSAEAPITPEGLLFFIEAADTSLNASHWPDVRVQTPYFVIPAWDPGAQPPELPGMY